MMSASSENESLESHIESDESIESNGSDSSNDDSDYSDDDSGRDTFLILNEESVMKQVELNNPEYTSGVFFLDEEDNVIDWAKYYEAFHKNDHLKWLCIYGSRESWEAGWGQIADLLPVNENLGRFLGGVILNSSIEDITISNITFVEDDQAALMNPNRIFQKSNSNLRSFHFASCNLTLSQEQLVASALENCTSLEKIEFLGIQWEEGQQGQLIFKSLKNHQHLRRISWIDTDVNMEAMNALRELVETNPNIEEFTMVHPGIDDSCIAGLATSLAKKANLRQLCFGYGDLISKEGIKALEGLFQSISSSLVELSLNGFIIDKQEDWQALAAPLQNLSALEKLYLNNSNIGNNAVIAMPNALKRIAGLEELYLRNIEVGDEGGLAIAHFLIDNKTLRILDLDENKALTDLTWDAFSKALCNESSVADTFASNHTLEDIYGLPDSHHSLPPLLAQNKNSNKQEVARQKIMKAHFLNENRSDTIMKTLREMELCIVPNVLAWMGMDFAGLGLIYKFLLGFPTLFEKKSKKRMCIIPSVIAWMKRDFGGLQLIYNFLSTLSERKSKKRKIEKK